MTDPSKGERQFAISNATAAKPYTREFISNLAKTFGISRKAEVTKLRKALRLAAWVYLNQKDDERHEIKIHDLNIELKKIDKCAERLKKTLQRLPDPVEDLYWAPLRFIPVEYYLNSEATTFLDYPIARHSIGPDALSIDFPNEIKIKNTVELISNLARHALKRNQPDKGGRPTSNALRMWVINMQHLWEKVLRRRFTFRQHQGTPVSKAFRFCQQALHVLDPSVTTTVLGTAMRNVIKNTPESLRLSKSRKVD